MRSRIKDPIKNRAVDERCIHYWIIESPHGPKSTGRCKFCGTEKEFDNWLSYSSRDEYTSSESNQSDVDTESTN